MAKLKYAAGVILVSITIGDDTTEAEFDNTPAGNKPCDEFISKAVDKHLAQPWFSKAKEIHRAQTLWIKNCDGNRTPLYGRDDLVAKHRRLAGSLQWEQDQERQKLQLIEPPALKVTITHAKR